MLGPKAFHTVRNNLGVSPRQWHNLYGTGSGVEALKGKSPASRLREQQFCPVQSYPEAPWER